MGNLFKALIIKEFRDDFRSRSGWLTGLALTFITAITMGMASYGKTLDGVVASGLIWAALLFASASALPRAVIAEDERGTADMLRLWLPPSVVFWGKFSHNLLTMLVHAAIVGYVYTGIASIEIVRNGWFLLVLAGSAAALSGSVTVCSALVSQAAQRTTLAGAIALPLLLPLVFLGVAAMRVALGDPVTSGGVSSLAGLWLYAAASIGLGPLIFETVWKT